MRTRSEAGNEMAAAGAATGTPPAEERRALARGVVWEQLALGFRRPSAEGDARLLGGAGRALLRAATRELDPAGDAGPLGSAAARFASRPPPSLEDRRLRYDRIFGHTARGPVCAHETEYGSGGLFRQPEELAHIAGYYEAFGLGPRRASALGERVDHIACECAFVGFLARKEALALGAAEGDAPARARLETAREAARSFVRAHLGRFGIAFGTRLRRADPEGALGDLGELLVAQLRADAVAWRVPLGPATLDLRPPEPDPAPMACGGCAAGEVPIALERPGKGPQAP